MLEARQILERQRGDTEKERDHCRARLEDVLIERGALESVPA